MRRLGFVNDEEAEVGKVHFGVVNLVSVRGEVEIREKEMMEGAFVTVGDLPDFISRMEGWSRLLVDSKEVMEILEACSREVCHGSCE